MTDKERVLEIYNKVKKWKSTRPSNDSYTPGQIKLLQEVNALIKEHNASSKDKIELISLKDNPSKLIAKLQILEAMIADSVVHA
jgi:hypothetical protein